MGLLIPWRIILGGTLFVGCFITQIAYGYVYPVPVGVVLYEFCCGLYFVQLSNFQLFLPKKKINYKFLKKHDFVHCSQIHAEHHTLLSSTPQYDDLLQGKVNRGIHHCTTKQKWMERDGPLEISSIKGVSHTCMIHDLQYSNVNT